jgi:hypothetical protein
MLARAQATCESVRLICEANLYWSLVSVRWLGAAGISETESSWTKTVLLYFRMIPSFIRGAITAMIRVDMANSSHAQGLSRHSPADQLFLAQRAVAALSAMLGAKPFFLGDFPAECDCSAFGLCENLLSPEWPNPLTDFIRARCPNLVAFAERVRAGMFADYRPEHPFPPGVPDVVPVRAKAKAS